MRPTSLVDEAADSERILIGSIILDPSQLPAVDIAGSDLSTQNRQIWDALLAVYLENESVDTSLVLSELRKRGQYWQGAALYLSSLTDGLPRKIALQGHIERIKGTAVRRRIVRLCETVLNGCHDLNLSPTRLLDGMRSEIAALDAPSANVLGLISAADVQPETVDWLIQDYVPRKCLSLLVGDPGDGKTWTAGSFSAALTRGRNPFGGASGPPQNVLYLSNEDSPGQMRARFDRLGGDPTRIWFESAEHAVNLAQSSAIEAAVNKYSAALVVIDTVTSHFGGKVDFHKASEVSAVLQPLAALSQRTGTAILGLMHLSKSMQGKSLYRVQGSTAFAGAARSVLGVGHDPSDPAKRILVHMKVNGSAQGASREFAISESGVTWGEVSGLGVSDVLGPETPAEERSETSNAMEFLREALSRGSRDAEEVKAEALSRGIKDRTLRRAKLTLKVASRKKSMKEGWIWWLPEVGHEDGQDGGQDLSTVQ